MLIIVSVIAGAAIFKAVSLYLETRRLNAESSDLSYQIDSALKQIPTGLPLSYQYMYALGDTLGDKGAVIDVYGTYRTKGGAKTWVFIKSIPIEDGDADFAIREAEELIDHLNGK